MTIEEIKNFYKNDQKEYIISKNTEFLKWYRKILKEGYLSFTTFDTLQETIDMIALWYELKYPERDLEKKYSFAEHTDFENIEDISGFMGFEQLMYRMPTLSLNLMKGEYRHKYHYNLREMDTVIKGEKIQFIDVLKYVGDKKIKEIGLDNLGASIKNWNFDLELRKRILKLVALKLLYSPSTKPEFGYARARFFIKEFNQAIPNLNLDPSELDKLINIEDNLYNKISIDVKYRVKK